MTTNKHIDRLESLAAELDEAMNFLDPATPGETYWQELDAVSLRAGAAALRGIDVAKEALDEQYVSIELRRAIKPLIAELRELRAANRWRPIAEGLPDDNINVLVWDGERVSKAFQRGGGWFGDDFYMELTHWRPLSDPPEGA